MEEIGTRSQGAQEGLGILSSSLCLPTAPSSFNFFTFLEKAVSPTVPNAICSFVVAAVLRFFLFLFFSFYKIRSLPGQFLN